MIGLSHITNLSAGYQLRVAVTADEAAVQALYHAVHGLPYCTWDDHYPAIENIREDIAAGTLFLLTDKDQLIGAVSIVPQNELDDLSCWKVRTPDCREFSRVVVHPTYQGRHLAADMISALHRHLFASGCPAIHLLAEYRNQPALRTYMHCGYRIAGEHDAWGHHYYACELTQLDFKACNTPE